MKTRTLQRKEAKAFTLIEMIGVLAVIAILASLLIPKIFEAINNARINNALISYNTVKTACMDHYAKYGAVDKTANGGAVPAGGSPGLVATPTSGLAYYDGQLLDEGFLDKPFVVKVGTNAFVDVIQTGSLIWDLSGSGSNAVAGSTYVVEAVIQGVPASDAKDLNDRLDGTQPPFTVTLGSPDGTGRVKWTNTAGGTAWIYLTHR